MTISLLLVTDKNLSWYDEQIPCYTKGLLLRLYIRQCKINWFRLHSVAADLIGVDDRFRSLKEREELFIKNNLTFQHFSWPYIILTLKFSLKGYLVFNEMK